MIRDHSSQESPACTLPKFSGTLRAQLQCVLLLILSIELPLIYHAGCHPRAPRGVCVDVRVDTRSVRAPDRHHGDAAAQGLGGDGAGDGVLILVLVFSGYISPAGGGRDSILASE